MILFTLDSGNATYNFLSPDLDVKRLANFRSDYTWITPEAYPFQSLIALIDAVRDSNIFSPNKLPYNLDMLLFQLWFNNYDFTKSRLIGVYGLLAEGLDGFCNPNDSFHPVVQVVREKLLTILASNVFEPLSKSMYRDILDLIEERSIPIDCPPLPQFNMNDIICAILSGMISKVMNKEVSIVGPIPRQQCISVFIE